MIFVFGLGNPGAGYEGTRHNVGFDAVSRMAAQMGLKLRKRCFRRYRMATDGKIALVEPLTYMNLSGEVFPELVKDGDEVIVIVDQMDLPPGRIRVRRGGSSAGHNGLKSIIAAYGEDFIRIYIGTGRPEEGVSVADHVLSRFSDDVRPLVDKDIDKAAETAFEIASGEVLNGVIQRANSFQA